MNVLEFTVFIWAGSLVAGFLGALTGLGGGIVIVPMLTLLFGVDIRLAAGASLISVIATSSGAAAAYVKEGYSNIRVGMFLEIATVSGAILGAFLQARISTEWIAIIFGVVLLYTAFLSSKEKKDKTDEVAADRLASRLRMDSSYPVSANGEKRKYHVRRVPLGFGLMFSAGTLSGLLGIGSGAMKVMAMDQAMRLPFKVSTTTSNFMIGVTAAASAGIYLSHGYIRPGLVMPVILGVLLGSLIGARILIKARSTGLRLIFSLVVIILALEMIYHGIAGKI